jgi:dephospho-CoA kinase
MVMFVVGITGGIGSGKSTVAKQFAARGIEVIDADQLARAVVAPGSDALAAIEAHFGNDIIASDGSLQRAHLRDIIFTNPQQRQWLEALLHPLINRLIEQRITASQGSYTVLVSPLLFEAKQHIYCDRVLVVDVPETVQVARVKQRENNSEEQIRRIIASQMPSAERLRRADDVIDNTHDLAYLDSCVEQLHRQYLPISKRDFDND